MELRQFGRPYHRLKGGIDDAIGNVVANGGTKEENILLHNTDITPQGLQAEVPDVLVINGNSPLSNIVKPGQEMDNSTLAATRCPQNSSNLARCGGKMHPLQRRDARNVRE